MQFSNINFRLGKINRKCSPIKIFDDRIINFLNYLSKNIMSEKNSRLFPDLFSFGFWCRKENMNKLKNSYNSQNLMFGRGIAFHVCPSNVPMNFAYSLVFGLLSGNDNIIDICSNDNNIYQLENFLGGTQDITGFWTLPNSSQLPNNPSLSFDPQNMQPGDYIYTVVSPPCSASSSTITVNLIPEPSSGFANSSSICINDYSSTNMYNLYNLITNYDLGGNWYLGNNTSSPSISSDIDPNILGVGNHSFTYEAVGNSPCSNSTTTVVLTVSSYKLSLSESLGSE